MGLEPPALLRLNQTTVKTRTKNQANGSESEGEAPGGDSSSDDEDEGGDEGKDLLHKLLEDGGELHKATGMGLMRTTKGPVLRNQWGW